MQHPIPPVYDSNSKILILGSFPSVKSREAGFFYGHPQNRFWKVLAALLKDNLPSNIEEKRAFLLLHGIALWDVIASCSITGSSDASIKDVVPNDILPILKSAEVAQVFTNGKTADSLYKKYLLPQTGRNSICLPSTSPANAAWTLKKLCAEWEKILSFL